MKLLRLAFYLCILFIVYMSGYNSGSIVGHKYAIQFDPRCKQIELR